MAGRRGMSPSGQSVAHRRQHLRARDVALRAPGEIAEFDDPTGEFVAAVDQRELRAGFERGLELLAESEGFSGYSTR